MNIIKLSLMLLVSIFISGCVKDTYKPASPLSAKGLKEYYMIQGGKALAKGAYNLATSEWEEKRTGKVDPSQTLQGCKLEDHYSIETGSDCSKKGGKALSNVVVDCEYADGGRETTLYTICISGSVGNVIEVFPPDHPQEVTIESRHRNLSHAYSK